jgi:hypothetical protein
MGMLGRLPAAAAAVALCALLVWLPSLGAGFVSDDFALLRAAEASESPVWPFGHNDLGQDAGSGHFYRPVWVLWNAGVLELFGDDATAFHAGNLLLFALIAVEVLLLARTLLPPAGALAAALAFALYPRHGESVAWASGSTDLLAVAFGLGALLCVLAPWPQRRRLVLVAALTTAAALAKEAAFLLPFLGALLLVARGERSRDRILAGPAAMAAALVVVFAARTAVLGGLGGYGEDSVGPGRVMATAVSYAVAAVSPSQLELLRFPALLAVPLALAGLLGWAIWRLPGERRAVALAGLAWFALALLPVLGLPLDLNNSNGERLMLLASVGLALSFGALVPERPRRAALAALVAAGLAAALLSADVARNWDRAGAMAERVARQAADLAPFEGSLVVVTLPDSYRSAHVFTNSFDLAVSRAGASYSAISWCVPVHVRNDRSDTITVTPTDGSFLAETRWDAPFDFPVLRDPAPLVPGCSYAKTDSEETAPGLRLTALATPDGSFRRGRIAYFDGHDLRPMRTK